MIIAGGGGGGCILVVPIMEPIMMDRLQITEVVAIIVLVQPVEAMVGLIVTQIMVQQVAGD